MMPVRTGITNGQVTQVSGPRLKEGMQVIAGVSAAGSAAGAAASPFGGGQQSRGGRPRPGGF